MNHVAQWICNYIEWTLNYPSFLSIGTLITIAVLIKIFPNDFKVIEDK